MDEWTQVVMLALVFMAGFAVCYMLIENQASIMASEQCGTCKENIKTMVENFNVLEKECHVKNPYSNLTIEGLNATDIR